MRYSILFLMMIVSVIAEEAVATVPAPDLGAQVLSWVMLTAASILSTVLAWIGVWVKNILHQKFQNETLDRLAQETWDDVQAAEQVFTSALRKAKENDGVVDKDEWESATKKAHGFVKGRLEEKLKRLPSEIARLAEPLIDSWIEKAVFRLKTQLPILKAAGMVANPSVRTA